MQKQWTTIAITKDRLNGLKIEAEKNRRSIGQHLELLLGDIGIRKMSNEQYNSEMRKLKK
jgi:hypothetical protein